MKKFNTRLTSLLLSILMVLGMFSVFPISIGAISKDNLPNGLTYDIWSNIEYGASGNVSSISYYAVITGYDNNIDTSLEIPSSIDGITIQDVFGNIITGSALVTKISGNFCP